MHFASTVLGSNKDRYALAVNIGGIQLLDGTGQVIAAYHPQSELTDVLEQCSMGGQAPLILCDTELGNKLRQTLTRSGINYSIKPAPQERSSRDRENIKGLLIESYERVSDLVLKISGIGDDQLTDYLGIDPEILRNSSGNLFDEVYARRMSPLLEYGINEMNQEMGRKDIKSGQGYEALTFRFYETLQKYLKSDSARGRFSKGERKRMQTEGYHAMKKVVYAQQIKNAKTSKQAKKRSSSRSTGIGA